MLGGCAISLTAAEVRNSAIAIEGKAAKVSFLMLKATRCSPIAFLIGTAIGVGVFMDFGGLPAPYLLPQNVLPSLSEIVGNPERNILFVE